MMSADLTIPSPNMQNHVIKVTALVTTVACGTYILWHTFIKDRPPFGSPTRLRPQRRRHRRIYTNDGHLIYSPLERVKSEEENSLDKQPNKNLIQPITRSLSTENINHSYTHKYSTSRDLSPGGKRPVTLTVSSRYHRTMPASVSSPPPPGYVTVYTNTGMKLWQRLHVTQHHIRESRTTNQWVLRLPFIQQWDETTIPETLRNGMGLLLLPMLNTNTRVSDESLTVHTGVDDLLEVDIERGMEEADQWELQDPEDDILVEAVELVNAVQRPVFIRQTQHDITDMGPVPPMERERANIDRLSLFAAPI